MVQLKNLLKLIFLALWVVVNGKIEIVFDGGIENCGEGRSLDLSKLEFVPVNDTHVVLNGSFIFNIEVRSPWFVKLTFEKFQNGKWQPSSISRNIPDFCSVMHIPTKPWYSLTKNFLNLKCPIAAATKAVIIDQQMNDFNLEIPPNMVGKWRLIIRNEIGGLFKRSSNDCHKYTLDIVET